MRFVVQNGASDVAELCNRVELRQTRPLSSAFVSRRLPVNFFRAFNVEAVASDFREILRARLHLGLLVVARHEIVNELLRSLQTLLHVVDSKHHLFDRS